MSRFITISLSVFAVGSERDQPIYLFLFCSFCQHIFLLLLLCTYLCSRLSSLTSAPPPCVGQRPPATAEKRVVLSIRPSLPVVAFLLLLRRSSRCHGVPPSYPSVFWSLTAAGQLTSRPFAKYSLYSPVGLMPLLLHRFSRGNRFDSMVSPPYCLFAGSNGTIYVALEPIFGSGFAATAAPAR